MSQKAPTTTAAVLLITAGVTGLQFEFPGIAEALQRTPGALSSGEWWRLLTPILVNRGAWTEIAFNLLSLLVAGAVVEWGWGSRRWLVFYLAGGLAGEGAGLAWRPNGSGSSVAVCGLLGALAVWLLWQTRCWQARLAGIIMILGAIALTGFRNLHGPAFLAGASVAGVMLWRDGRLKDLRPAPSTP